MLESCLSSASASPSVGSLSIFKVCISQVHMVPQLNEQPLSLNS